MDKPTLKDTLDRPAFVLYNNTVAVQQIGTECRAKLINATTTDILLPTVPIHGIVIGHTVYVTNLTGADLLTNYVIPNGSTWLFGWDGTVWDILSIS